MTRVAVRIFHPLAGPAEGPLEGWLRTARSRLAERHRTAFMAAGADDVRLVSDPPDDTPFGRRLRDLAADLARFDGVVLLGSGAFPLATLADRRRFVVAAAGAPGTALANNHYSADAVAIAGLDVLHSIPDLATDNAIPRWLEEAAGFRVDDLRTRWRLAIDLDSPLDLVLSGLDRTARGGPAPDGLDLSAVRGRVAGVARVAADRRAELVVTGRTSAATLAWLERKVAARVRALIEERGLRAGGVPAPTGPGAGRPPASLLGALLDRDGPKALGAILARLGEAAVVDTRVLLAHRLGRDERAWPRPEDRFASDLMLPDRISDPWLRDLTRAAADAPIPVLLGAHTLVGPGLRLVGGGGARLVPRGAPRRPASIGS